MSLHNKADVDLDPSWTTLPSHDLHTCTSKAHGHATRTSRSQEAVLYSVLAEFTTALWLTAAVEGCM